MNQSSRHSTTEVGNKAEAAAADYLEAQGYQVLARNWKIPVAEIDIVAKKDKCLYFIEVRYRRTRFHGDGLESITRTKLSQMQRSASFWLSENRWGWTISAGGHKPGRSV